MRYHPELDAWSFDRVAIVTTPGQQTAQHALTIPRANEPSMDLDGTSRSVIRRATPTDAEAISAVLRAAFSEYEPCYTPEAFAATVASPAAVRQRMREGPVWIALQRGGPVGTVAAMPRGDALYIRGMAVVPAARGTGVGTLLLDAVVRSASREGYRHLTLSTTPFLTHAIRLYERWGFRTLTAEPPEAPPELHGTPLIAMTRPVAAEA